MKNNESGFHIQVENLDVLIKRVETIGPLYQPANKNLELVNLRLLYDAGKSSIKEVNDNLGKWKLVVDDRQDAFKKIKPLVTRIIGNLYSMTVPPSFIEDARQYQAKINSTRLSKPKPSPKKDDTNAGKKQHSVSQQSYNSLLYNFEAFIKLLDKSSNYETNIPDLTIAALNDFYKALDDANLKMNTADEKLSNARIKRDLFLYAPETGLVDTALSVKNYIKGIFGAKHPIYVDVRKIKFANRRRK